MQTSGPAAGTDNFYPRPPRGGRRTANSRRIPTKRFLSTPSARRATAHKGYSPPAAMHFYPRPPRGGRRGPHSALPSYSYFYPRPPRGGRRYPIEIVEDATLFLSTPSARRATRACRRRRKALRISIHALREEGDDVHGYYASIRHISIHALREEGDSNRARYASTCSDFYPRPPRGGRPIRAWGDFITSQFLSTPSARRATACAGVFVYLVQFLSTPSARRATRGRLRYFGHQAISIHALREEGDTSTAPSASSWWNFYPRPPRGGRPCRTIRTAAT